MLCFNFVFFKKKKILSVLWFSKIFGCVCHEQDSIKFEKFIT